MARFAVAAPEAPEASQLVGTLEGTCCGKLFGRLHGTDRQRGKGRKEGAARNGSDHPGKGGIRQGEEGLASAAKTAAKSHRYLLDTLGRPILARAKGLKILPKLERPRAIAPSKRLPG